MLDCRHQLALLAACGLALGGCGKPSAHKGHPEPPSIDVSHYDTSCHVDADCELVDPDPCSQCSCTTTPIASHEDTRFVTARRALHCPPPDPSFDISCGGCPTFRAACVEATCKAVPPRDEPPPADAG